MGQVWTKVVFFKMWYDKIGDVERADVSVLVDVISEHDSYKPFICEILLSIEIICVN